LLRGRVFMFPIHGLHGLSPFDGTER
jgi:hypothetical protein